MVNCIMHLGGDGYCYEMFHRHMDSLNSENSYFIRFVLCTLHAAIKNIPFKDMVVVLPSILKERLNK